METHQEITTEWKGILNFEGNWADFYPEFLKKFSTDHKIRNEIIKIEVTG